MGPISYTRFFKSLLIVKSVSRKKPFPYSLSNRTQGSCYTIDSRKCFKKETFSQFSFQQHIGQLLDYQQKLAATMDKQSIYRGFEPTWLLPRILSVQWLGWQIGQKYIAKYPFLVNNFLTTHFRRKSNIAKYLQKTYLYPCTDFF